MGAGRVRQQDKACGSEGGVHADLTGVLAEEERSGPGHLKQGTTR
jgi:hypothetical protein